ncbi:MAG: metallophosphoesterase family protein [Candidatus Solibacter sp.]|jgi:protein phosphatase
MKLLIVSDLHANLEALQAVLAESHDELWVLGDLVNYGPNPREVVDLVRTHASLVVQGNHDYAVGAGSDPQCSSAFREMARAMQSYTEPLLDADRRAFLHGLPRTAARTVGGHRFFLCHATPAEPLFRYCPAEPAPWASEIAGVQADIVLTGHTHLPFTMSLGERQIVNPGSVGQPKHGAPMACYALWEDGILSLQSRPYPVEETVRKIFSLPVPKEIRSQLAAVLRRGFLPGRGERLEL